MMYGFPSANITQKQGCYDASRSPLEYQPKQPMRHVHVVWCAGGRGRTKL